MQSRRMYLPEVAEITPFADAVAEYGAAFGAGRAGGGREGAERAGGGAEASNPGAVLADLGADRPPDLRTTTILVGPEGGWSDGERNCGLGSVTLGGGVLRAETAAVAAGTLVAALRSGVVRPAEEAP
jgi:16S rRNA U1498 N3-methylase RsmE